MSTPTCGELSCDECNERTAALITERDQLRAEVERLRALGSWAHTCMHHNDKQRTECPVCLVTTLTAERDQLRADRTYNHECINRLAVATGTLGENSEKVVDVVLSTINQLRAENATFRAAQKACEACDEPTAFEVRQLGARAERAEAALHAATEECTDVRLKWHAVMGMCAAKEDSIMEADEELVCLRARAERAEAELAKERARLDWVFHNCKVTADGYTTGNRDVYAIHDREDLGAAMLQ